jgi:hypothetical protein
MRTPPISGYVGIIKAAELSNKSPGWLQRQALLGRIKTEMRPGIPPQYCVADVLEAAGKTPDLQLAGA